MSLCPYMECCVTMPIHGMLCCNAHTWNAVSLCPYMECCVTMYMYMECCVTMPVHGMLCCYAHTWNAVLLCPYMECCVDMPVHGMLCPSEQVNVNEPLSFIQRLTEELLYAKVLEKAAACEDPLEQMAYVSGFASSVYASTIHRVGKPFNPLLGETYECDRRAEHGWRCFLEQVGGGREREVPLGAHRKWDEPLKGGVCSNIYL